MSTQTFYRADKRDFAVGEVVGSAGEFLTKNPEGSQDVEDVLEETRPERYPSRNQLYVFENIQDAKKHWSKMTGGKLYEVLVENRHILHRGDMSLVDMAFRSRDTAEIVRQFARRYWSGEVTEKPVIELLVQSARVSRVISKDEEERQAHLRSWTMGHAQPGAAGDAR